MMPRRIPIATAHVLGLKLSREPISPESVARAIGGKKLLLVLDNCEHVVDAAARLAETLVRLCPSTSIVATSREGLRIEGEHVYRVPPLDVPGLNGKDSTMSSGTAPYSSFHSQGHGSGFGLFAARREPSSDSGYLSTS
jgi:predicted ATPase